MKKPNAPSSNELTPALRGYLYATAAVTGAAIMIVEILGAKMLSPYVGTSHFVWTAQIAVTLVALAAGYYLGGRLVDRSPQLSRLYWAILFAAIYLALTVVVCEPVAYWCLEMKPFALGSLVASLILFFVPLLLLAMVGPYFVRIITSAIANVGGNMGRLTAISTMGSFLGTLLIGYLLIPFLPNSWTMCLTACLLMLVSAVYFALWGRAHHVLAPLVTALLAGAGVGSLGLYEDYSRHHGKFEKFYGNSNFGMLQVMEVGSLRYYLNDYLVQNTYDPATGQSTSLFTYMLHGLARVYTTNIENVLCIGLGVGIAPMEFARDGAAVDVVEINGAVVPVAERWFGLEPRKLNIKIGDGRPFLNRCAKQYDVIALDAFLGDGSPAHLMTREAFMAMRRALKPDGALVINSFASLDDDEDFFAASLYRTLTNVFPQVRLHSSGGGNTFFVASSRSLHAFARPPEITGIHPHVQNEARLAYAGVIDPSSEARNVSRMSLDPTHGRVLTDDYNPVEFYDVKNRERIRRNLALSIPKLSGSEM